MTQRAREGRFYRRKAALTPMPANDPRHGTANGYQNRMCRCAPCTAANAKAQLDWWRKRHPDAERSAV